jgi:hypothetical protein
VTVKNCGVILVIIKTKKEKEKDGDGKEDFLKFRREGENGRNATTALISLITQEFFYIEYIFPQMASWIQNY